MLQYQNIGLTAKIDVTQKERIVSNVIRILRNHGATVFIDHETLGDVSDARGLPNIDSTIQAMIVIGGDGTILRAFRHFRSFNVPILSINTGQVGFLAEISVDEAEELIPRLLSGEGSLEERSVFSVRVERNNETVFDSFCLNEAAISQGAIARLLDVRTTVNDEYLTTFHADGLIVATPTGSTAYSLAAGGPVVHPGLDAMILTPINSHSLTQKPIVIPGRSVVCADIENTNDTFTQTHVSLTLDGQEYFGVECHDKVFVSLHPDPVSFLRRSQDGFFRTLREKLHWGQRF